jgi:hypothetical protein
LNANSNKESRRPDQLLNQVLEGKATKGAHDHLYDLYQNILKVKVGTEPQDVDDFARSLALSSLLRIAVRYATAHWQHCWRWNRMS